MRVFKIAACSIIALMGAAGAVAAGGASANSPGSEIKGNTPEDKKAAKGASDFAPGSKTKATDAADKKATKGASGSAPGKNK
jgi:hypothetical protein